MNGSEIKNDPSQSRKSLQALSADVSDILNTIEKVQTSAAKTNETTIELQTKIKEQSALIFIGYFVLIVMVATMLVMVLTFFIQTLKDDRPNVQYQVSSMHYVKN